jgi:hypothetical protein
VRLNSENSKRSRAGANYSRVQRARVIRPRDNFWPLLTRIRANHLAPIRSFLIDFASRRAPRIVVCAKFFDRADPFAANSVNAKWIASLARKWSPECDRNELPSLQKPLFHRTFLNFFAVRMNFHQPMRTRVAKFEFDRVIALHCVA